MIPDDFAEDRDWFKDGIFGLQVALARPGRAGRPEAGLCARRGRPPHGRGHQRHPALVRRGKRASAFPIIPFDEALHGLIRSGATSFPQAIGLAASWDADLDAGGRRGHRPRDAAAAASARSSRRSSTSPATSAGAGSRKPTAKIPISPRGWPPPSSRAFEKQGVIATPKHFAANVGDGGRDSYPIHDDERWLREVELPPFRAALAEGGARSIMSSYNSLGGSPASANDRLLNRPPQGRVGLPRLRHLRRLRGRRELQPAPDRGLLRRIGPPGLGERPGRDLPDGPRARRPVRQADPGRAGRTGPGSTTPCAGSCGPRWSWGCSRIPMSIRPRPDAGTAAPPIAPWPGRRPRNPSSC